VPRTAWSTPATTPAANPAGQQRTRPRAAPMWPPRRQHTPARAASPTAPHVPGERLARPLRVPSRSGH
jgi:hypothetical protein